jgi:phosphatidylglycerol:prolipoprotein diacylglycerol transferase
MFPTICQIGPIAIYSYGVMMAVAVIVCSYLFSRDVQPLKIPSEKIYNFVFWVVLGGILGARIYFIFLNLKFFTENPLEIIMIQRGGLCWQGGLIVGTLTAVVLIKKNRWPFWQFLDYAAPYAALGQSIGRIGCFFNGCCYGKEVPWGIYFPVHQAHLHPAQLYDAAGLLLIFFLLKKIQQKNKTAGCVFVLYFFELIMTSQRSV